MPNPGDSKTKREVLLEFVAEGSSIKVTAIDPETGIEASIVGPASAPRAVLGQAAARKLTYLITKKKSAG